jgi:prophage regulatory protein
MNIETESKFIKIHGVIAICGISRAAIYKGAKAGTFPAPVKLGPRSSGWFLPEVMAWVAGRIKASRPDAAGPGA